MGKRKKEKAEEEMNRAMEEESAEEEVAAAFLAIIRALDKLDPSDRQRVVSAAQSLITADNITCGGVVDAFLKGSK